MNCWVKLEDVVMSGTVVREIPLPALHISTHTLTPSQEIIRSENTMISINPADPLPTVQAENCKDLHLYYYEPHAVGNIYTVCCENVVIHLQPPHPKLTVLDIPTYSPEQFVSTLFLNEVFTSKVLRGGRSLASYIE